MTPMESPGNTRGVPGRGVVFAALAVLVAAAHFAFVMSYFRAAYSTMDAHGYHNQAKLLATTGKPYFVPENDIQYIGYTWKEVPGGRYYTLWPPGFPALLAVVYRAVGAEAALYVNPVMASLCVFLLFVLGSAWLGRGWGLAAAALLALNPVLGEHALSGYSHVTVMMLVLGALVCLARREKGGGAGWMFAAGLLFGIVPAVRVMEGVFVPLVFGYVLLAGTGRGSRFREALIFAAGAAAPILALGAFNQIHFGASSGMFAPWKTGYSFVFGYKAVSAFKFSFFKANAAGYINMLISEGGGPAFVLAAAGIAHAAGRRETFKLGFLVAWLAVPLITGYMFYFYPSTGNSMRFFVPLFPLFAMVAAYAIKEFAGGRRGAAAALLAVMLGLSAAWGFPKAAGKMKVLERNHEVLVRVESMLEGHAPAGSVVIADEALCQFLDYSGRWKLVATSGENRARFQVQGNIGQPGVAGTLSERTHEWAGDGGGVYWLMPERMGEVVGSRLPPGEVLERIDGIRLTGGGAGAGPDGRFRGESELMRMKRFSREIRPEMRMEAAFETLMSRTEISLYEWKLRGVTR